MILFLLLVLTWPSVCGQQCPSGQAILIQASELGRYGLEACETGNDYTKYLTSFLANCTFTRSADVTGKAECQHKCVHDADCYALRYTQASGCEICRPSQGEGVNLDPTGNSYPLVEVFVSGSKLKQHIDGKSKICVFNLITLRARRNQFVLFQNRERKNTNGMVL